MKLIRVFVSSLPRILRDIVIRLIAEQEDIQIVGGNMTNDYALAHLDEIQPDVLLMASGVTQATARAHELLFKIPTARVISITTKGGLGIMHELRPHEVDLGEISPVTLVDAIRGVGRC